MRRAFFFILAVLFANASFASIPRVSLLDDAPAIDTPSAETRVWASDVLAPFERQAESELTRALRQGYEYSATTNASGLGRFLSVDPTWESARLEMPQSWNRYSYVMNNPMKYTDPDGRVFKCHTITKEDGTSEQICSEEIDVEAPAPTVEPEPEPQQAGILPLDFGSVFDGLQNEAENLKHLTLDDLSFRHAPQVDLGQCIEDNSFSNVYTAAGHTANAALNMAVGGTGRVGVGGVRPHATTWQHKLGSGFGGANASRVGRAAGRGAIVLTVFEGFYDIGTIGRCGALAAAR